MHVRVNGTQLWFDVEGLALVPEGPRLRERPTVVVVHGGPGTYDHSYFKPEFARLAEIAQVVYPDLPGHGRSAWGDPSGWSFEACADDLRAFCDALGIVRPVLLGHSMGGIIVMLYGARHPDHARALIVQSGMARLDLERVVAGFRRVAGDRVAELARLDYGGAAVSDEGWAAIFAAFGPRVPSDDQLSRRVRNPGLSEPGMNLLRRLDLMDNLPLIAVPTLVCVGELDPVTPVAASREIVNGLAPGLGRLEVIEGAGHFPWLDAPDRYWAIISEFVESAAGGPTTG